MLDDSDTLRSESSTHDFPASVGQRLLWLLEARRSGRAALNCPVVFGLDGPLDVERLRDAVTRVVARHEALRTTIARRGRRLWQVIHEPPATSVEMIDLSNSPQAARRAHDALATELRRPIGPAGFPLRATLWRVAEHRHVFCLNVHHLATDAWSGAVIARDLKILYEHGGAASGVLPAVPVQYREFSARQEDYLRSELFTRDCAHWRSHLAGAAFDSIPMDSTDPSLARETASARVAISASNAVRLKALARASRTTLFALLLGLYFSTIHRLTGKRELTVASVFANRLRPDLRHTVGFLANLVALRSIVPRDAGFQDILAATSLDLRDAFVHQACPLHLLPAELTVRQGRRVDDAVFQMLPQELDTGRMRDVAVSMLTPEALDSRFDFEATVVGEPNGLALVVLWNRGRVAREWVAAFLREYASGVADVLQDPGR